MISKIEKIKNVGNFEDYDAHGDVSLKKMNLIYAENGAGKTTLTRILYSLSINNPDIINQRKRFESTTSIEVSIRGVTNQFHFNGLKWNKYMDSIEVFDNNFVEDNVYSSTYINNDQRRNLYKFVLGDIGVKIAKDIDRVKSLIDTNNQNLSRYRSEICSSARDCDFDEIYNLQPIENIDQLIDEKVKELQVAQNNDVILRQSLLPTPPIIDLPVTLEEVENILSICVENIGTEYVNIVKKHIDDLHKAGIINSQEWIFTGINAIQGNECPFCGNSLDGVELIEGYNQFFSDKYKGAIETIQNLKDRVTNFNLESYLEQVRSFNTQYDNLKVFWSQYIEIKNIDNKTFDNIEELGKYFKELKKLIEEKVSNPIEAIEDINLVREFYAAWQNLTTHLNTLKDVINNINSEISGLKRSIRNIDDVQKELFKLQLVKTRFIEPLSSLCNRYKVLDKRRQLLQSINVKLQVAQKSQTNQIFENYGQKINYYLENVFHTKYKLEGVRDGGLVGRSKESYLYFELKFNGTSIHLDGDENNSFRNVLSEGDKNLIAFCFFLAKITIDQNCADKIIVFDDPISSFDENRRQRTIEQLIIVYKRCKQVIVLSHNFNFLLELFKKRQIESANKKSLQIVCIDGKSTIEEFALKDRWINRYLNNYKIIEDFSNNPSQENKYNALSAIRICLETFLKFKYCKYIDNSDVTLGKIIDIFKNSDCQFINGNKEEVIFKLDELNDITSSSHHGNIEDGGNYSEVEITMDETEYYVIEALEMLKKEL